MRFCFVLFYDVYRIISLQELDTENLIQDNQPAHLENETTIKLPCAGRTLCDEKEESFRTVTSSCAICLSCYQSGERIVWSSNEACAHIFHHDCMITWINKRRSIDCPCCRQPFVGQCTQIATRTMIQRRKMNVFFRMGTGVDKSTICVQISTE